MTRLELLLFKCSVPSCGKFFWSYFEVIDSLDKKLVENYYDRQHEGIILNCININGEVERKCRKCRKGLQLDMFFDPDMR